MFELRSSAHFMHVARLYYTCKEEDEIGHHATHTAKELPGSDGIQHNT